ncbi:MAG: DUF4411 family protein [Acidimicrobiales bacterium]
MISGVSLLPGLEPEPVWIVDTSALINFKTLIGVSDQWDAFKLLEQLVKQGRIAMPRQVINEASKIAHPDLPGAWAPGVRDRLHHPLDVDYEHILGVMREAGDLVDPNKSTEDADPYVLAQAVQLQAQGLEVVVVTDDDIDRMPIKISLATACGRLGVCHVDSRGFLTLCGVKVRRAPMQGDGEDE